MTGGSPLAEIRNSRSPDRLQTEISVTSTEMVGGSPPAHIEICDGPDRLQTEISVMPTEMAGGSLPADLRNSGSASNSDVREDSDVRQVYGDGYARWRGKQYENS